MGICGRMLILLFDYQMLLTKGIIAQITFFLFRTKNTRSFDMYLPIYIKSLDIPKKWTYY